MITSSNLAHRIARRPSRYEVLITSLLLTILVAVFAASSYQQSSPVSAQMDYNPLPLGVTDNWQAVITPHGIGQSFVIPSSSDTPMCDIPGTIPHQKARITQVQVKILVTLGQPQDPPGCRTLFSDLLVTIRPTRTGAPIARAFVPYYAPSFGVTGDWMTAHFPSPPILETNTTYYLVLQHSGAIIDPWQGVSAGIQSAYGSGTPVAVSQTGSMNSMAASPYRKPTPCSAGNPTIYWKLHAGSPDEYPPGTFDTPNSDGLATIYYLITHQVRVLALIYDPLIGVVNYTDDLTPIKPIPSHDYTQNGNATYLHEVLGLTDPASIVNDVQHTLERESGYAVDILVDKVIIDGWSPHLAGTLTYTDTVGQVFSRVFSAQTPSWTVNTYPCYPHIPDPDVVNGQNRMRRACYPANIPAADYNAIFLTQIRGQTITTRVNNQEYDDIWILDDSTSRLAEAVMADGTSGLVLNNAEPVQITGLTRSVPVMGFNWYLPPAWALHSYGHRTEDVFAGLFNGNRSPTCLVNRTENNVWAKFVRIYDCYADPGTPIPPDKYGGIGTMHKAFIAQVPKDDRNNPVWVTANRDDFDYEQWWSSAPGNVSPVLSNEKDWYNFPNFQGWVFPTTCQEWGCNALGYMPWWFRHLPRYEGFTDGLPNNIWPYASSPGCFEHIPAARDNPTPTP